MKELVCIVCPKGCRLSVDEENGFAVTGNSCPRGAEYGKRELCDPHRTVTSTVHISGAIHPRLPVKTDGEIKKTDIFKVMQVIKTVRTEAPVETGEILVRDIAGTGVNLVSTKTVAKIKK